MIPATAYQWVYILLILLLCIVKCLQIFPYSQHKFLVGASSEWRKACILSFFLIIFMGARPIDRVFADTVGYAQGYEIVRSGWLDTSFQEERGEVLWAFIHDSCAHLGWPVYVWFTLIEALYIGLVLIACYRMMRQNVYMAMLFVFSSFSFFSYGVNGIRNGMACSLIILALSYYVGNKRHKVIALLLCCCAFYIHHSTILPALCMIASDLFIKKPSWSIIFWFLSIGFSLTIGGQIESFFAGLGFDNRFAYYIQGQNDLYSMAGFSHVGFRWDFLLYSCMPILLGVYLIIKKKRIDKQYQLLFNTYVLSNAFWIMLIRASFSNRFAYLSWFMYAIVLAYPLLKIPIWEKQGTNTSKILIAHVGFTFFMICIYY